MVFMKPAAEYDLTPAGEQVLSQAFPAALVALTEAAGARLDVRAPRRDESGAIVGYEGTGYLPVARFYQELTSRIAALPGVAFLFCAFPAKPRTPPAFGCL